MSTAEELDQQLLELLRGVPAGPEVVVEAVRVLQRGAETVVEVTVDRKEGIESLEIDQVAEISRLYSDALDQADPLETGYSLEVSTPGAESNLTQVRHYQRNLNRTVQVRLRDGDRFEGTLTEVGPEQFTVETVEGNREIPYANVRRARPVVQFNAGGRSKKGRR